jgi:hypothetical protein
MTFMDWVFSPRVGAHRTSGSAAFRAVKPMTTISWHTTVKHQASQDTFNAAGLRMRPPAVHRPRPLGVYL